MINVYVGSAALFTAVMFYDFRFFLALNLAVAALNFGIALLPLHADDQTSKVNDNE